MRQSTQLILNTAIVYGRMGIGFVVGLLLTRELLGELGEIDYGLFLSVGAAWALLNIFVNSLYSSGQRHLAHALGTDDRESASRTFSCLCVANGVLALGVLVVGLLGGDWILSGLDVPAGRENAAAYVYYIGFATLSLMVAMAPYTAALLANQQFFVTSVFDLSQRIASLVAVYAMMFYTGDKLVYWSVAFAAIQLTVSVVRCIYTYRHLPWARFKRAEVAWAETKEIIGFANWMLVGNTVIKIRMQGTLLVFNYFFGNAVAAAQGISMQLATYQNQMTIAISQTVRPMLTGQVARGDNVAFHRLTLLYCKFTTLAAALFGIVALAETETLLDLWLKKTPPFAVEIAWWTLLLILVSKLSIGYVVAMQARGELAGIAMFVQLPEALFLIPVMIYMSLVETEPWQVPAAFTAVNAVLTLVVLPIYAGQKVGLAAKTWLIDAALPTSLVLLAAFAAVWSLHFTSLPDLPRLVVGMLVNVAVLGTGGWFLVLNQQERGIIAGFAKSARQKLGGRRGGVPATNANEG